MRALQACTVLLSVAIASCGSGEATPDADAASSSAAAPSSPAASAAKKAPVPKSLEGSWYRDGEGDALGLEFGSDGKVMLTLERRGTMAAGQVVTLDWSALEDQGSGARVRLIQGNGQTLLYAYAFEKGSVTFTPETAGGPGLKRFVRLDGQSVAQAHEAHLAVLRAEREALVAEVLALLDRQKLALVSADPGLNLYRSALELEGSGPVRSGTGYRQVVTVTAHQAEARLNAPTDLAQPVTVAVTFGPVVGPPGMPQSQNETEVYTLSGRPGDIQLLGGSMKLVADEAVVGQLTSAYKAEVDRRNAELAAFADHFAAYTRLDLGLRMSNNPAAKAVPMDVGLLRVDGQNAFLVADLRNKPSPKAEEFHQNSPVVYVQGAPRLALPHLNTWLSLEERDGQLVPVSVVNRMDATFEVAESLTKDELIARRAVVAEFLSGPLSAGVALAGRIRYQNTDGTWRIRPLHVRLTADAERRLTGVVGVQYCDLDVELEGQVVETLLGATLTFEAKKIVRGTVASPAPAAPRTFALDLDLSGETPRLVGPMRGSYDYGEVELALESADTASAQRAEIDALLKQPTRFIVRMDGNTGGATRPLELVLGADASDPSAVAGKVVLRSSEAEATGRLVEENGATVLELSHASGKGTGTFVVTYRLWVLPEAEGVVLSGYADWPNRNPRYGESMSFSAPRP